MVGGKDPLAALRPVRTKKKFDLSDLTKEAQGGAHITSPSKKKQQRPLNYLVLYCARYVKILSQTPRKGEKQKARNIKNNGRGPYDLLTYGPSLSRRISKHPTNTASNPCLIHLSRNPRLLPRQKIKNTYMQE